MLGIAIAAIVNVVQAESRPEVVPPPQETQERGRTETVATVPPDEAVTEPLPALLPMPGELREEGGILWWVGEDCEAGSIELASGAVRLLPAGHCRVWPAPAGDKAVAVSVSRSDALDGRGLVLLEGGTETVLHHTPGFLGSEVAWAPDGSAIAACFDTPAGTVVDVLLLGGISTGSGPGCSPAWVAEGLAISRSDPVSIVGGGRAIAGPDLAAELLPSIPKGAHRAIGALGSGDGRLVASFLAVDREGLLPESAALAVLAADGSVDFSAKLAPNTVPVAVGIAPDGGALWYFDARLAQAAIVEIPGGRRHPPFGARWVAWSPGGHYLAAATRDGIVVSRWPGGETVATVPVRASDVTWTLAPSR